MRWRKEVTAQVTRMATSVVRIDCAGPERRTRLSARPGEWDAESHIPTTLTHIEGMRIPARMPVGGKAVSRLLTPAVLGLHSDERLAYF